MLEMFDVPMHNFSLLELLVIFPYWLLYLCGIKQGIKAVIPRSLLHLKIAITDYCTNDDTIRFVSDVG